MAAKMAKRAKHNEEEDRLSNLPDSIIHHIFSLIPTLEAVRTSVLSKRWKRLWVLSPSLHVASGKFTGYKFIDLVNKFLNLQNLYTLERFKLSMDESGRHMIDGWLRVILGRSKVLKEMDLCIQHDWKRYYCLSLESIRNVKSLTVLKLEDIKLKTFDLVELPWLKVVLLKCVSLNEETLKNLLLGCSSIEHLVLDRCPGLSKTKTLVSSSSLKSFLIHHPMRCIDRSIRVEAANLESFRYDRGSFSSKNFYDIDIGACRRVTSLSLGQAVLDDQWLEGLFVTHLRLQNLTLDNCTGLTKVNIQSQHLKVLDLCFYESRCEMKAINIDTPNLVSFSFRFEGRIKPNFSINAPNLLEASIKLVPKRPCSIEWHVNLIDFLRNFNRVKCLCLIADGKALLIPGQLRKICKHPLPTLKHLNVKVGKLGEGSLELRNALRWMSPSVQAPVIQCAVDNL